VTDKIELIKKTPLVDSDEKELTPTEATRTGEREPFQDFDLYQMFAEKTNVTPPNNRLVEILTGLSEELGEFMSFHKRMMRGDYDTPEKQQEALILASKELGDMLWYMSAWCTIHAIPFGEIPYANLEKLKKRYEKNMIKGTGDTREQEESNVVLCGNSTVTKQELVSPVEVKEEVKND